MPDGFANPIVGGNNTLIRKAIQSKGYTAGTSGWIIKSDGTAEFNGITVRGTVIVGNGTTNTIIFDPVRGAMFEYDSLGNLVASIAAVAGNDSFGNAYPAGITSFFSGNLQQYSRLNAGSLLLTNGTANTAASMQALQGLGSGGNQAGARIQSGSGSTDQAVLQLTGQDLAGTLAPYIQTFKSNTSTDMVWAHCGTIQYANPGTLAVETWHAAAYQPNWVDAGSPYRPIKYQRDANGYVRFVGAAKRNATDTAPSFLLTLPAGYRPDADVRITGTNQPSGDATGALAVNYYITASTGLMVVTNIAGTIPSGFTVSLEGVAFSLKGS